MLAVRFRILGLKEVYMTHKETEQKAICHIDREIGGYIREKRTTSDSIAKELEISPSTLSYKRNGKTSWRLGEIIKLSDMLEMTEQELIHGK